MLFRRSVVCFLSVIASLRAAQASTSTPDVDRAELLSGVSEIGAPGSPGGLCVFGPQAFAVVGGKAGGKALEPVVAAARWERGRIVAFGHNGYLGDTAEYDTGHLLLNAVRWAAGTPEAAGSKVRVAVAGIDALQHYLEDNGLDAKLVKKERDWTARLSPAKVLCVDAHSLSSEELPALAQFIRNGGGLVTAATGWGWASTHSQKNLAADFPGNQLLAPAGLVWTGATPGRTTEHGYAAGQGDLLLVGAAAALDLLLAQSAGKSPPSKEQLEQAGASVSEALQAVRPNDPLLLPRVTALQNAPGALDFPKPEKPLASAQAVGRLMFTRNLELLARARPEQIRAHPAAEFFPGGVPADAPRISNRAVAVETAVPAWHSTGLYAPPGGLIRVEAPAGVANQGLSVRIGCHNDRLWELDTWKRAPEICRVEKIAAPLTLAANPFGGPIYIEVPEGCPLGAISVTISGGVEAPRFVLGRTKIEDWRSHLRQAPGPWAELETSKVILSVPSKDIRALDDPEALLQYWDRILDAEADLATIPHARKRPERIVADVQISVGYMHSGYPIMTPLDSVANAVQLDRLKAGSWGHFHELGHNHQQGDWTFNGTVEVTCNLFSLYVSETVCGLPPGLGHPAMVPAEAAKRLRRHLADHANFDHWKNDPFLALVMYDELRQGFGWDPYKKVFAEYRTLPKDQRPKTDDEKRDQWMVRFSRMVGKNLGPFFVAWGVPTSEEARASIAALPAWMPPDWPK